MNKPYIIRVSSQKGGVGKTAISVNFASALRSLGYRTLVIDFDFTNPSVGFHLGLEGINSGTKAAMEKKTALSSVVSIHEPTGMHVIAGEVKGWDVLPDKSVLSSFVNGLKKTNYNFIIVDTAPGFEPEAELNYFDEGLIITTPDVPSCASAVRLSHKYNRSKLRHSLIVNKIRDTRYELSFDDIMDMYGGDYASQLPEDDAVPEGIAAHIPAYNLKPRSRFSRSIFSLVKRHVSAIDTDEPPIVMHKRGLWHRFSTKFPSRKR